MMRNRIDLLNQIQPYVGVYYSQEYVQKKILRMSDKEIDQMNEEIKKMQASQEQMMQQGQDGQPGAEQQQPQQTPSLPGPINQGDQ